MNLSLDPASHTALIARLRAAGCVFAEEEADMIAATARNPAEIDDMAARRAAGLPLEQVLGWAEFCGRRVAVDAGVFVPRRRTEFLVERAVAAAPAGRAAVVVDLCCGTGAVGAAVVRALRDAELHAADVEPAAVRCAARNVAAVGGRTYEGDLFTALPAGLRGRVDVLVANVPYVPSDEIALLPGEARDHEPRVALDGGADGLGVLRRVAAEARAWLAPGGTVLSETSEAQRAAAVAAFAEGGLDARSAWSEELGATVVEGLK
ncbi:putative protein N(5)-glutamine methyltransferase [Streptomyces sp. A7024]|uniref:peptide chain release factor N(5)-glutamine methyltransferase n=1 Tax=Streptomyces coryli TaxID=1128680 RepID=A0A6G4U080_9ACTN|nr:putative protein N(5)-glutamine methyltransferase [Streptomyces coryli]NGN65402.1 putative protein N(5)-glutamine methyltransferase [Streptomyces coryli]